MGGNQKHTQKRRLKICWAARAQAGQRPFSQPFDGIIDYFGEGQLQIFISEKDNILSIHGTLHERSYVPCKNTNTVVIRAQLMNGNRLNVPFPYDVPGIEPAQPILGLFKNLYLPSGSRMALSRTKTQWASSSGSHKSIEAVVTDEWMRAAQILAKRIP